jgi:2-oxo-4-hydroxy-4-carboxy-5-ureidoimidazoline decarboxylase
VSLDALPAAELREVLHEVCASPRWVDEVAAAAPYGDVDTLLAAAELALAVLDERDIDDALAGHPRIGERSKHASSALEQAGVGDDVRAALAAGNREYEARFGQVYLVAASGRTGDELLAILGERLNNDPARERAVVREELSAINRLRLQRLVEEQ